MREVCGPSTMHRLMCGNYSLQMYVAISGPPPPSVVELQMQNCKLSAFGRLLACTRCLHITFFLSFFATQPPRPIPSRKDFVCLDEVEFFSQNVFPNDQAWCLCLPFSSPFLLFSFDSHMFFNRVAGICCQAITMHQ